MAGRIADLILATKGHAAATSADMALMIDIDLAILGANPPRFADYEHQIREEYHWVPGLLFRRKRRQFVAALLARPRIYHTDFFRARLEAAARRNLQTSLESLDRPLAEE